MKSESNRRDFLTGMALAAGAIIVPTLSSGTATRPSVAFPSAPRERISICSYPFREFIAGDRHKDGNPRMDLKDFAAHVMENFKVHNIEPWTHHFPSTDPDYLQDFRKALEKAGASVANMAVDTHDSPYANDREERERAIVHSKKWIDVAVTLGSPSIRTNIARAKDAKPNVDRIAESLRQVVAYAASKNIVVHLENDDEVSEDPFLLIRVVKKVKSSWLRLLPDFGNTLAAQNESYNYRAIDSMFRYAYGICHVKGDIGDDQGEVKHVDMARTFSLLRHHWYKGYCSIEYDALGDPYAPTAKLVEETVRYLS
jgi:sugar phosphate isomerase/epimerase